MVQWPLNFEHISEWTSRCSINPELDIDHTFEGTVLRDPTRVYEVWAKSQDGSLQQWRVVATCVDLLELKCWLIANGHLPTE